MRIRLSNNRIFVKMGRIFDIPMANFYVCRNKNYILMANTQVLNACVTVCEVQRAAHKTASKYSPSTFSVQCIVRTIRTFRTFRRKYILFLNLNSALFVFIVKLYTSATAALSLPMCRV